MERLRMTHSEWLDLESWERETWIAREIYREKQINATMKQMRGKNDKYSEFASSAILQALIELL